jgi:hypothetical protein
MRWEYKVLLTTETVNAPNFWQLPSTRSKQFAAAMENTFNRMSEDGWEYVDSYYALSEVNLIFRRQTTSESKKPPPETGIKEAATY